MKRAGEISLFITIILWATLIGGIMYSHMVFFPPYLSHLPESTAMLNGPYGLHDEIFWQLIHPVLIVSLLISLALNWKATERRKFILIPIGIYALAIIATFTYFVPELKAFADSAHVNLSPSTWLHRGQQWQYLSWTRGALMYFGFLLLLIALTKNRKTGTGY